MTDTTIATNIHQSLDIQLDLATEITFYFEFSADDFTDFGCLVVTPLADLQVTADSGANLLQQFLLPFVNKKDNK